MLGVFLEEKVAEQIDKIEINKRVSSYPTQEVLEKQEDIWIVSSDENNLPVKQEYVARIFESLKSLELKEIVSQNPVKHSVFEVAVDDEYLLQIKLIAGDKTLKDFYLGKNDWQRGGGYLRLAGSDTVYLTSSLVRSSFEVPDFRDKSLIYFEQDKLIGIKWDYAEAEDLEIIKAEDDKWMLGEQETQDDKVLLILEDLLNLEFKEIIKDKTAEETGLLEPELVLNLQIENEDDMQILIGNELEEEPDQYAGIHEKIYIVSVGAVRDKLMKEKEDFEEEAEAE